MEGREDADLNTLMESFSKVVEHNLMKSCLDIFVAFTPFSFSISLSVGKPLSSVPNG